jgi:hypothetical protein
MNEVGFDVTRPASWIFEQVEGRGNFSWGMDL